MKGAYAIQPSQLTPFLCNNFSALVSLLGHVLQQATKHMKITCTSMNMLCLCKVMNCSQNLIACKGSRDDIKGGAEPADSSC